MVRAVKPKRRYRRTASGLNAGVFAPPRVWQSPTWILTARLTGVRQREFEEGLRRQDIDTPERVKGKEVVVAGNEVRRVAVHCQLQEHIVVGVAANHNSRRNLDPLSFSGQGSEEVAYVFEGHVFAKLFPAKNIVQFRQHGERE